MAAGQAFAYLLELDDAVFTGNTNPFLSHITKIARRTKRLRHHATFFQKWMTSLPRVLCQAGTSSPDLTQLICDVLICACRTAYLKPTDLDALRPLLVPFFFGVAPNAKNDQNSFGPFVQLPEELQFKALYMAWWLALDSPEVFKALTACCMQENVADAVVCKVLEVTIFRAADATANGTLLSFLLTTLVGRTAKFSSSYTVILQAMDIFSRLALSPTCAFVKQSLCLLTSDLAPTARIALINVLAIIWGSIIDVPEDVVEAQSKGGQVLAETLLSFECEEPLYVKLVEAPLVLCPNLCRHTVRHLLTLCTSYTSPASLAALLRLLSNTNIPKFITEQREAWLALHQHLKKPLGAESHFTTKQQMYDVLTAVEVLLGEQHAA